MSIYLGIRSSWDKIVILSIYNYYYTFKKESKYMVIIKNENNAMGNKGEICTYSNMSKKNALGY